MKQKNKHHILSRYGIIIGFSLFVTMLIVGKLFLTTVVRADEWENDAKQTLSQTTDVPPKRGSILADNGNILACNLQVYDIKLDLAHEAVKTPKKKVDWRSLDSLADSLDRYYPMVEGLDKLNAAEKKKHSWHTRLKMQMERKREERNRAIYLVKKGSSHDYDKIMHFPWMNRFLKKEPNNRPLYKTERDVRIYPFGEMAQLSVGRVNMDSLRHQHGYSGLERDLDSLLYGVAGEEQLMPLTTGMTKWMTRKPVNGYDVHTTINIDMQDMLEEELKRECEESHAIWATALIMEVRTGAIKAISNLQWIAEEGRYGEALNRAMLAYEPGSVMKPISMMIAFEDGLVKSVNDMVDCSPFMGTTDKHAPPVKNMKQVIEMSSNTGIARVIFRGFGNNPEKYHERLQRIGFFDKFHTGIHEERIPFVPHLTEIDRNGNRNTMKARQMALARQAYGYNTMVPPLYTMAFYNAIANDGVLIYPRLINSLSDDTGRDSTIRSVEKRICSPQTAAKVRECLREVVVSKHGTGHILDDDRVAIAGKTGTAFPLSHGVYDTSFRRLAFAGFFPYEHPKYTMMVLMLTPAGCGAASSSGMVLKNMALRLYSRGMLDNVSTYTAERISSQPVLASTSTADLSVVRRALEVASAKRLSTNTRSKTSTVPDVRGYDPVTAINLLETKGLNVRLQGSGHVVGQSIEPGAPIVRGQNITLTLKI